MRFMCVGKTGLFDLPLILKFVNDSIKQRGIIRAQYLEGEWAYRRSLRTFCLSFGKSGLIGVNRALKFRDEWP